MVVYAHYEHRSVGGRSRDYDEGSCVTKEAFVVNEKKQTCKNVTVLKKYINPVKTHNKPEQRSLAFSPPPFK